MSWRPYSSTRHRCEDMRRPLASNVHSGTQWQLKVHIKRHGKRSPLQTLVSQQEQAAAERRLLKQQLGQELAAAEEQAAAKQAQLVDQAQALCARLQVHDGAFATTTAAASALRERMAAQNDAVAKKVAQLSKADAGLLSDQGQPEHGEAYDGVGGQLQTLSVPGAAGQSMEAQLSLTCSVLDAVEAEADAARAKTLSAIEALASRLANLQQEREAERAAGKASLEATAAALVTAQRVNQQMCARLEELGSHGAAALAAAEDHGAVLQTRVAELESSCARQCAALDAAAAEELLVRREAGVMQQGLLHGMDALERRAAAALVVATAQLHKMDSQVSRKLCVELFRCIHCGPSHWVIWICTPVSRACNLRRSKLWQSGSSTRRRSWWR